MATVYPPAVNEAVAVLLVFVLLLLDAVAITEQAVQTPFGVTTIEICASEPDCSVGIWHTSALLVGALQVPEFAAPLISVTPAETVAFTWTFVAGSGPSLSTVKVAVTGTPALNSVRTERTGATQVTHNSAAVPNWKTNALRVPLS